MGGVELKFHACEYHAGDLADLVADLHAMRMVWHHRLLRGAA
jgi:hypothetical protein